MRLGVIGGIFVLLLVCAVGFAYRPGLPSAVVQASAPLTPAPPSTIGLRHSTEFRSHLFRSAIAQIARDFSIAGELECHVKEKAK